MAPTWAVPGLFIAPKGPLCNRYFAIEWMFKKSQRVPPFTVFGNMRLTGDFKTNFEKNLIFSIFSFLRAFLVSSCRKSGFRVLLSLRIWSRLGPFPACFSSDDRPHTDRSTFFTETTKTTQAKSGQGKLSAKVPPFIFFLLF